jgi:hypothetical protein
MSKRRGLARTFKRFVTDVISHTPIVKMVIFLVLSWLLFSAGIYLGERGADGTSITSYPESVFSEGCDVVFSVSSADFML